MEQYKELADQIWTTRISRVNAEKRLINKENFIQAINVYYSCLTIVLSILSFINKDDKLSLLTIFMTISLLSIILHLNGQKYLDCAQKYKENYTKLQMLEFDLKNVMTDDTEAIRKIYKEYCKLLNSSSNHISYDYYKTVHDSSGEYKEKRWYNVKKAYSWNIIWRAIVKGVVIVLPILLYVVCEVL